MENQFFYTTVAGLALSLAGFAGVIASLRGGPSNLDPINLWRVKAIVSSAIFLMMTCLVLVPIFNLTSSIDTTVRIGAGLLALKDATNLLSERRRNSDVWPGPSWRLFVAGSLLFLSLAFVSLVQANRGLLEIVILAHLFNPAGIFFNYISEIGRDSPIKDLAGIGGSAEVEGGVEG